MHLHTLHVFVALNKHITSGLAQDHPPRPRPRPQKVVLIGLETKTRSRSRPTSLDFHQSYSVKNCKLNSQFNDTIKLHPRISQLPRLAYELAALACLDHLVTTAASCDLDTECQQYSTPGAFIKSSSGQYTARYYFSAQQSTEARLVSSRLRYLR